jgi:hypothetical protein
MGHVPKPPVHKSHVFKDVGHGPDGPRAGHIVGTCHHTMEGFLIGTDNHFHNPGVGSLTDYGIGAPWDVGPTFGGPNGESLDGVIYEWIDPESDIVPWANGKVGEAMAAWGDAPAFLSQFAVGDIDAVNRRLRSIETSDKQNADIGKGGLQIESLCFLTAWIHAEQAGQTADTFRWNMHHNEFGVAHQQCPGAWIINNVVAIQDRAKAIMRAYQEDLPLTPPLRVTYPPNWTGGLIPEPGQTEPAFSAFPSVRIFHTVHGAVGRQDPILTAPILQQFPANAEIEAMGVVMGQTIAGDSRWLQTNGAQPMAIHVSGLAVACRAGGH